MPEDIKHDPVFCTFQPEMEPGDVIIVLKQQEHELYTRDGEDLYCTYNLSLTEALCGFQFTLKHLDERDLLVKSPPGDIIHPGELEYNILIQYNLYAGRWLLEPTS